MYVSLLSFPLFFGLLCVATNFYFCYSLLLLVEIQAFNALQRFLKYFGFLMVFSSCRRNFSTYLQWLHRASELHLTFCPCLIQPHNCNARLNTLRSTQLITFGGTGINICPSYALSTLCWRILYGLAGSLRWWAGFNMFLFLVVNCLFQCFLW